MTVSKISVFKSWLREKRPGLIKVFEYIPKSNTQRRKEIWSRTHPK